MFNVALFLGGCASKVFEPATAETIRPKYPPYALKIAPEQAEAVVFNSSVVRITMNGNINPHFYHAVLPGDALGVTEDTIDDSIYFNSDIFANSLLNSPHHGSSENDSNTTIQRFNPDYVVASAGTKYSHPHKRVINAYENSVNIAQVPEHCVPRGFNYATETEHRNPPLSIDASYDKHKTTSGVYSTLGAGPVISQVKIPHDKTKSVQHQLYANPGTLCN